MPHGVLAYLRTGEGNDALAWVGTDGKTVTESQFEILKAAECSPETPVQPRQENHHDLVRKGVDFIALLRKKSLWADSWAAHQALVFARTRA